MTIQTELKDLSHRTQMGDFLNARGLTGKGVEVGTLYGAHATDILKTWKGHLYCVDPWINQPDSVYFDGANKHDMNNVFRQVSATLGKNKRCTLMRMMSLNAVGAFDDGSLDMAYLDGNHGLSHIRADIAAWWPKVKIGGLVCGHDYFTRYDKDTDSDALTAVAELAEVLGVRAHVTWETSWWFIKTKAMDDAFRKACLEWRLPRPVYSDNGNTSLVIVMPVAKFDWNLAVKNLAWMAALKDESLADYQLLAYCSPEITEAQQIQLRQASGNMAEVVVASQVKEAGYFGTPNQMIKGALELVENRHPGCAMLWVEADAIPMRAGWVDAILAEYRACGRPFLGDHYRGTGAIPHLTGNAVYSPQWRKYAPSLAALGSEECGWDTLCAHDTMPRSHPSKTIQQVWRPPLPITLGYAKSLRPECALFHQCKDGSLIDVLCEQNGMEPIPLLPALAKSTYDTQKITLSAHVGPVGSVGPASPVAAHLSSGVLPASASIGPVEILIVTYAKDMEFLRYCLKAVEKFAHGFSGVTLVVPEHERGQYDWAKKAKVRYFAERSGKGMLHHEVQICRADEWCPGAWAVLHLDPDCIMWRKCSPADFFVNGKPILYRERYTELRNPNRRLWQKAVEDAVGFKPEYETMCRHPAVHLRDVYRTLRNAAEKHTGMAFDDYVLSGRNEFPQSYAEYPALGAIAIRDFRSSYEMVDYDWRRDAKECGLSADTNFQMIYRRDREFIAECWSHGGISKYKSDIEAWLSGRLPAYWVK